MISAAPFQAREAKRDEHRQRGDAATRTSDPKFDARFKLGYQLSNKGNEVGLGLLMHFPGADACLPLCSPCLVEPEISSCAALVRKAT